ncbi:Peptidase S33, tripeptidyl-peptidase [Cordyceps javanica]|uniref:Peptidase S33, tripeptidyl-peptidase n=1 Tax=Cordyceps javanica TaxID=43265 RepID=A0A545V8Q7_9HYPO|nr:Peptidase S33, tripeptidyl-peptidase [Cordyceps javanica]TQW08732.1 Peptidase S33, tripeptidyl-peptidase [Cordyceps javanica]
MSSLAMIPRLCDPSGPTAEAAPSKLADPLENLAETATSMHPTDQGWACRADGQCDLFPDMDLSQVKVIHMKRRSRLFQVIHRQPSNKPDHILMWGEVKGCGIVVWSSFAAKVLRPDKGAPPSPKTKRRFILPVKGNINATLRARILHTMKQECCKSSGKLNALGFTKVTELAPVAADDPFDWRSITPSTKLAYSPCLGQFQCARLIVPLDWLNKNVTDTVSIAIIKLPAVVSQDHPSFGSTIIVNPGGPGGSGTDFLIEVGRKVRSLVDIRGRKHYEVLAFDPRGVGGSRPIIDCYPGDPITRRAKGLEMGAYGGLRSSNTSFTFGYYTYRALGRRCQKTNGGILPYVNTPSVARDMAAMVDKVAELRHEELGRPRNMPTPRLQYLGFSYGTVLGNYFASLFPERVGRMVLDGVADSNDYANGPGWLSNTQDSDRMMEMFFEGCFDAGSLICPLRQPGDKKPSDISERTWSWIKARDTEPIEFTTADGSSDILLRSNDIRSFLFRSLYFADVAFFTISNILAEAIGGNSALLASRVVGSTSITSLKNLCPISNDTKTSVPAISAEANRAVLCVDGDDVSNENHTYWKKYMEDQISISSAFGDLWAEGRLACAGWRARSNWSFKGPFKTPAASKTASAPEPDRPAAPLLFLSSEWDPVTPLRNARAMASQHPGAGVLVLGSMGHGALRSGIENECVTTVVSEYFDKGIVPEKEVYCSATKHPWKSSPIQTQHLEELMRKTRYNLLGIY